MENTNVKPSWREKYLPSKRRLIQLYSALLYNAHLRGFVKGDIFTGLSKSACVPGFNCYSCPGAIGACPLGSLQAALAQTHRHFGFYVFGILLLYGLIFGRTICGWLCPLGMIQELLNKLPTPKLRKSRITRALSYLKYVVLVIFAGAVPLWYGFRHGLAVPGFCKYICPAGTLEGAMGLLSNSKNIGFLSMLNILFTRKFVIMLMIGLACVFCYRSFCRFLCPLGAVYGMFSRIAVIGVKVDPHICNGCGTCVRTCKMDVRHVGDHECIHCAQCLPACPQGAISLKAGSKVLIPPQRGAQADSEEQAAQRKKSGRTAAGIALAVLGLALIWFNFLDPAVQERTKPKQETAVSQGQKKEPQGQPGKTDGEQPASAAVAAEAEGKDPKETAGTAAPGDASAAAPADTAQETGKDAEQETGKDEEQETAGEAAGTEAAPENWDSDAPVGYEIGEQLEDFTLECLDGTEFRLSENRGKVTFINLWATYCDPCVQELPHFNEFYEKHAEDLAMIAVHSSFTIEDAGAYAEQRGWHFGFPLAVDTPDRTVFDAVNGSSTLPQTIVLNRRGEVIFNRVGSVTPELLEQLYEEASADSGQ